MARTEAENAQNCRGNEAGTANSDKHNGKGSVRPQGRREAWQAVPDAGAPDPQRRGGILSCMNKLSEITGTVSFLHKNPHLPAAAGLNYETNAGKGGSLKSPKWSDREDAILKAAYLVESPGIAERLAPLLSRSVAGIHCRAGELGISFSRGKYPHKRKVRPPKKTKEQLSLENSQRMVLRHANVPHPMLGKEVPQSVRDKISKSSMGKIIPPERVMAGLKTKHKNGTLYPRTSPSGWSWKAGWREIGNKRIYARSRWEANYARYLEWLKANGQISEWEHEPETFWFEQIMRGCRSYLPDFKVTHLVGPPEYIEVKGWMDPRSKTKIKRMAKYHPTIRLTVKDRDWFKANRKQMSALIPGWESGKL